ncbi:MAG: hypothetical protein HY252_10870 [Sphingobacteriales bacterium]|nr:hypothetical protein [Sphingobacteriales bacterium]
MNRIVKIFSGTTFDFALVVFLYFVARLLRFFVGNFFHHSDEGNIPYTFYSLWILLLFLIPYFILTKRGLAQEKFLGFLFIVYFAGSLSSALTRWLIHYLPKVDNIEIIKSNFIGVAGLDEVEHEDYYGNETSSTEHSKSYVYVENDSRIERELSKLEEEHSEGTSVDKFIFWQTALAAGYNPKYIPNYNCCNLSSDKLELYFTVGPLVMIEALIEAIKDALLVLVVLIIYRIRNKPMFFENFAALKKYMTEDIYKDKPNSKSYRSYSNYDNY